MGAEWYGSLRELRLFALAIVDWTPTDHVEFCPWWLSLDCKTDCLLRQLNSAAAGLSDCGTRVSWTAKLRRQRSRSTHRSIDCSNELTDEWFHLTTCKTDRISRSNECDVSRWPDGHWGHPCSPKPNPLQPLMLLVHRFYRWHLLNVRADSNFNSDWKTADCQSFFNFSSANISLIYLRMNRDQLRL